MTYFYDLQYQYLTSSITSVDLRGEPLLFDIKTRRGSEDLGFGQRGALTRTQSLPVIRVKLLNPDQQTAICAQKHRLETDLGSTMGFSRPFDEKTKPHSEISRFYVFTCIRKCQY